MKIRPKVKRNLLQILPFGIISFIASIVYALLEKGILGDHPIYLSTGNPYKFNLIVPSLAAFLFGSLIGSFEIFYLSKWFKKDQFLKKMILKTSIYIFLILLFILLITSISNAYELRTSPISREVWKFNSNFLSSFAFWTILIYITIGITLSLLYIEVSNSLGQSLLLNFFTGKYHHPIEEERIFMFLDMKSSTTIAEKLGHIRYFDLLQAYYADLSDAVVKYGGSIYQYVGDEIVLTWKFKSAQHNTACIDCFFAMKTHLGEQAEKYQRLYEVIPTFKAGIHMGRVTAGEIGIIKKEIVFTGDVLNTTARIQSLCNQYKTDLLVSQVIIEKLSVQQSYSMQSIGNIQLRGKEEEVGIYRIWVD